MKHTPGPWLKSYIGPICAGVSRDMGNGMEQIICSSILPDTDEEYEGERGKQIEADMDLIAKAPAMRELLEKIKIVAHRGNYLSNSLFREINEILK